MTLLYRSHAARRFDVTRGDIRGRAWWQAAALAVAHEEALAFAALDDMTFRLHCAVVAGGGDVDRSWQAAVALYDAAWARHLPWLPPPDRSARPLRTKWMERFGDPSDPAVAAAVARTVAALLNR